MATAKTNVMESINSGEASKQPKRLVSPPHLQVPGNSDDDALARCSSMPDSIDAPVTVQLRSTSSRSRRKAQLQRNSVAITSSDYYNQRRPQISQLAVVQQTHVPLRTTTAPLHPITESDSSEKNDYRNKRSSMVADIHDLNGLQITDSRLFRYRSNPSLGPPSTSSRPTTPQPCNPQLGKLKRQSSTASTTSSIQRADSILSLNDSTCSSTPRHKAALKMGSQAIPLTASTENQFLPLYINPESGFVYMFEDDYYIPLTPENVKSLQETARVSLNTPPIPDRRSKASVTTQPQSSPKRLRQPGKIMPPPSDYFVLVQILMVLYGLCLNLPVLVLCSIPALICSLKVRRANRKGKYELAKRRSEYVMCFSILGVVFHVFFVLAIMTTFLLLHFLGGYFTVS